jgi:hypothetical protein
MNQEWLEEIKEPQRKEWLELMKEEDRREERTQWEQLR